MWYCLSFNPYRVFKFVATVGAKGWTMACGVVSIPIGFSSSLQRSLGIEKASIAGLFQSLSGFQVRCNIKCEHEWVPRIDVSIPIGFSSSLQLNCGDTIEGLMRSFNPYRVFKFVATPWNIYAMIQTTTEFQSLSGFQVRCNITTFIIPSGSANEFQSLSGFQVRCNLARMGLLGSVSFLL